KPYKLMLYHDMSFNGALMVECAKDGGLRGMVAMIRMVGMSDMYTDGGVGWNAWYGWIGIDTYGLYGLVCICSSSSPMYAYGSYVHVCDGMCTHTRVCHGVWW